jgi:hypothetical protein
MDSLTPQYLHRTYSHVLMYYLNRCHAYRTFLHSKSRGTYIQRLDMRSAHSSLRRRLEHTWEKEARRKNAILLFTAGLRGVRAGQHGPLLRTAMMRGYRTTSFGAKYMNPHFVHAMDLLLPVSKVALSSPWLFHAHRRYIDHG